MPRHYFFLADSHAHLLAEQPAEPASSAVKVPEWVNILPEPDDDGLIRSRDNRILHIDSLEKLAKRSNAALRKQGGGGLVDADHKTYGGWFTTGGGPALGWAEEFEYRPGKGLWSRTNWLPEGQRLIGSQQYRYTSSVVSGETEPEVDEEAWSVTWHIFPEVVEGFGITNIPALVTRAMFAERPRDERSRDDLLAILLKQLGLHHNAELPEVREAFKALKRQRFSAAPPAPLVEPDASAATTDMPSAANGVVEPAPTDEPPDADGEVEAEDASVPAEPPPAPAPTPAPSTPPGEDPATQLAAARSRIAELEETAGASFVDSLVHSGKMTPAQKPAALAQAKTAAGLAWLRDFYKNAVALIPSTPAVDPTPATDAPFNLDPTAYALAQQRVPLEDIVRQLIKQRNPKETPR